jgi:hypothetical protein
MFMDSQLGVGLSGEATVTRPTGSRYLVRSPKVHYEILCVDSKGWIKWGDIADNLVTDEGIINLLNVFLTKLDAPTNWYVGLVIGPNPVFASGDKAASHPWAEFTSYTGTGRPQLILPRATATTIDNSASKANFTCSNTATAVVSGLFIASNSAIGATTGVLYSEALFSQGDKNVAKDDILAVTATLVGVTA